MRKNWVMNVLVLFLVGILMTEIGSATYNTITDFKKNGINTGSISGCITPINSVSTTAGCKSYFGDSDGDRNDACACDEGRGNKVTCCDSYSTVIHLCDLSVFSFSNSDGTISCCIVSSYTPALNTFCGTKTVTTNCGTSVSKSGTLDCGVGASCVSNACVPNTKLNTTYWANMNGVPIESADLQDSVLMIFGGYQLENKIVNYTVQEFNGSSVWWNPLSWFGSMNWNTANKISGNAYQPWIIVGTDKKRFNATTVGASNVSGNLSVSAENNSAPIIGDVSPADGARVKVDTNVWFNQSSFDEDDLLEISWDFGDGTSVTFYNYSSYINVSSANVLHNYTEPGVYHWTLEVSEMRSLGKNPAVSTKGIIYVFDEGINVMPVITSPENGKAYGETFVLFNATQSFVANCTDGIMSGSYFPTDDGLLNCSYLHSPGKNTTSGYTLTANWTLDDDAGEAYRVGLWNVTDSDGRGYNKFSYYYRSGGVHYIKLKLIYED